jgi:hypothetical protein
MKKLLLTGALLCGVTTSGCMTRQEQELQLAATDHNECLSYGASAGSAAYVQCRSTKSAAHEQAEAEEDTAWEIRRASLRHHDQPHFVGVNGFVF